MALAAGTSFGAYTIVSPLGAGGMGEVYRARDTKLNRDVAIKILPASFSIIPDRVSRFAREAQVLASLNHPHIAQIYGFEDAIGDGSDDAAGALVMEFVDGLELAQRIVAGPVPLDEALSIGRQTAEALEYAHERGVIHRDLKPANIKISAEGGVKVLDFGLAKALDPAPPASSAAALSPTFTSPALTNLGVILGTAAYMSPEQAKGKPVDRRADIWALGVVLFEMLSGRPLYRGETITDTIAQLITQPPDWSLLPADTPAPIRRLLRKCLEKDPRNRLQSAGDVRIEIDDYLAAPTPAETSATVAPRQRRRAERWVPWAISAALLIALAAALLTKRFTPSAAAPTVRLDASLGTDSPMTLDDNFDSALAVLSPDGQTLAMLVTTNTGRRLFVRALSALTATPLPGTERAQAQFFSPDGRWLAFFTNEGLKKIAVTGGAVVQVAPVTDARGGAWGAGDTIVYAPTTTSGLFRVSASGGTPAQLTTLAPNDRSHRWPSFLPDGKAVLFVRQQQNAAYDDATIEAVRLDSNETKVLVRGGTFPHYLPTGHLVYTREGTLFAVPFNAATLEVTGAAQPVLSGVLSNGGIGAGGGDGASQIAFADNGTMAYLPGTLLNVGSRIAIVDRAGKPTYTFPEVRQFKTPRLSPDGHRIAVEVADGKTNNIYVIDTDTDRLSRTTFEGTYNATASWAPDGRRIAYVGTTKDQALGLAIRRSDGAGRFEPITTDNILRFPGGFSPDGRLLAATEQNANGNFDVVTFSLPEKQRTVIVSTPANEMAPAFSPDGKWIAYFSDESGRSEIYVRSVSGTEGKWQVSTDGGQEPAWTKNGREIVYLSGNTTVSQFMAADISVASDGIHASRPHVLFEMPIARPSNSFFYDASADGNRFVVLTKDEKSGTTEHTHVTIVLNFFNDVRRAFQASPAR